MSWSYRIAVVALLSCLLGAVFQLQRVGERVLGVARGADDASVSASDTELKVVDIGRSDLLDLFEATSSMSVRDVLGIDPGDVIFRIGDRSTGELPEPLSDDVLRIVAQRHDIIDLEVRHLDREIRILLVVHEG
jgi:hypothetical protein